VTAQALGAIWRETTTCLYCGRDLNERNKSVEHMQPMAKGGAHTMANVIIVCLLCNHTKNQKAWTEWLAKLPAARQEAATAAFRSKLIDRYCDGSQHAGPRSPTSGPAPEKRGGLTVCDS
jgi:HNH endonuclease